MPDVDAEKVSLEPDSVSFMETIIKERDQAGLQNGFSPTSLEEDHTGGGGIKSKEDRGENQTPPEQICPVGLHKAVLLYPSTIVCGS